MHRVSTSPLHALPPRHVSTSSQSTRQLVFCMTRFHLLPKPLQQQNKTPAHGRVQNQRQYTITAAHDQQEPQLQRLMPTIAAPALVHAAPGAMDRALDSIGTGRFHIFLLFCVSMIWAGDAMEVMVLSYLGPATACAFGFSATQQSVLSSVVFGGMVLGAASWGIAADALGRKTTLLASCSVIVLAGLASAAAPNYEVLLLSRACVGFGLAGAPVAFTLLIELLPAAARGTWGTLVELAWTAGTVVEALLAWWLLSDFGWRPLLLASVTPLVLLLVLGRHLPESPRYLLAEGDATGAQAVLQRIADTNGKQLIFKTEEQYSQMGSEQNPSSSFGNTEVQITEHERQNLLAGQPKSSSTGTDVAPDEQESLLAEHRQATAHQQRPTVSSSTARIAADVVPQSELEQKQNVCQSLDVESPKPNRSVTPGSTSMAQSKPQSDAAMLQVRNTMSTKQHDGAATSSDHQQTSSVQSAELDSPKQSTNGMTAYDNSRHTYASSPHPGYQRHIQAQQKTGMQHQLQQLFSEVKLAAAMLSKPPYSTTTALLLFTWAATSFAYYGLVQLVAQLHLEVNGSSVMDGGPVCTDGMLKVPSKEYVTVLVTSAAEVPAVAWAAFSTNWLGRRVSIATSLGLTAACLLPCIAVSAGVGIGDDANSWHSFAVQTSAVGMFGARLFIMSAFTLLWVFTPELFPTHVRAFGLGINNAFARVGGLLSPFAAINLVARGVPAAAEGVFAAAALAACATVLTISSKHDAGQPMEED